MKIAFINGSPRGAKSTSKIIIDELKSLVNDILCMEYTISRSWQGIEIIEELADFDAIIFAFPLYVDGIPAHLLDWLKRVEQAGFPSKKINVYCVVNCGFYEGIHGEIALDMIKSWSEKVNLNWGMGVSVGAGGMYPMIKDVPLGKGPKSHIGSAYKIFIGNVMNMTSSNNIYTNCKIPRFTYKIAAELGFIATAKKNGLSLKDIRRCL